jgi:hypothetical protein
MKSEEKTYNYLDSRTRITVENAFGLLKNCFRRFKAPLNQRGNLKNGWHHVQKTISASSQAARIIRDCLTLHNMFIAFADDVDIEMEEEDDDTTNLPDDSRSETQIQNPFGVIDGEAAKIRRDFVKVYLSCMNRR